MRRKKKRRVPIILIVALFLCLGMVIFCGSQLAGIFLEYKEGTDEYDELRKYVEQEVPDELLKNTKTVSDSRISGLRMHSERSLQKR